MMAEQKYLTKLVNKITIFFGVNFSNNGHHILIIYLQILFLLLSLYFAPATFENITKFSILMLIYIVQVTLPFFVEIFLSVEAFNKRKLEFKILKKFEKIENILKLNFNCEIKSETNAACFNFAFKILILLFVRLLKIKFSAVPISLHMMIPELVCSISDYSFIFYVDILYVYVNKYCQLMNNDNIIKININDDYLQFLEISNMISKRFSVGLLLNVTFNFIVLIIDFYWIFIRISFNRLKLKGLLTAL